MGGMLKPVSDGTVCVGGVSVGRVVGKVVVGEGIASGLAGASTTPGHGAAEAEMAGTDPAGSVANRVTGARITAACAVSFDRARSI